jgi:hypothetical protein
MSITAIRRSLTIKYGHAGTGCAEPAASQHEVMPVPPHSAQGRGGSK